MDDKRKECGCPIAVTCDHWVSPGVLKIPCPSCAALRARCERLEKVLSTTPMESVLWKVRHERQRQDEKWGEQNHSPLYWLGILVEEVGELSKEIIEGHELSCQKELIQVAAVAVAWLEMRLRNERAALVALKEG